MSKKLLSIAMIAIVSIVVACSNKKNGNEQLSTDIVNNPASANAEAGVENLPEMTFDNPHHDFGKIKAGEKVTFGFTFKNTGKSDLIISDAKGSCGCTVAEYPKEPISAGSSGSIEVSFDSHGKSGIQNKSVTLITNAIPSTKVLNISGEVMPANN
jgi:hypothetical protein